MKICILIIHAIVYLNGEPEERKLLIETPSIQHCEAVVRGLKSSDKVVLVKATCEEVLKIEV